MLLTTLSSSTTLSTLLFLFSHLSATPLRRLLHHPFFPLPSLPPPAPSPLPSLPFSTSSSPDFSGNPTGDYPFFPTFPTPPPPSSTALSTFPANVSSLSLPISSSSPPHSSLSSKLILTLVLLSLLTLSLFLSLFLLLLRHRNNHHLHYPPSPSKPTATKSSTTTHHHLSHPTSDFLCVTNPRDFQPTTSSSTSIDPPPPPSSSEFYLKLCGNDSPELRPLPPLPKSTTTTSSQQHHVTFDDNVQIHFKNHEEFFSPTSSDNETNNHSDHLGLNISPT